MRMLVTGATGFVGSALVPALVAAGQDVVAATRHPEAYAGPVPAVRLDLDDPSTLAPALAGIDVAYFLVHGMESADFAVRDRVAAEAFAAAAAEAGARIVYLGGLGDDGAVSEHLRSRHEVGEVLRAGADTVELRAAMVVGPGSASFEILRQLVGRLPAMVCPKWVDTRCQPIALVDAVDYLVAAPGLPAGSYDVGGADVLTYRQMLLAYARLTHRRRLIVSVPVLTPHLSSLWIGLVTDQPPSIARPLVEGLSVEVVADDARIRSLVPRKLLTFEEAVRDALSA
jgi:uncharacterized protein YbjT (DUF2867 family)